MRVLVWSRRPGALWPAHRILSATTSHVAEPDAAPRHRLYALNSAGWAPAGWTPEFFRNDLGLERMPGSGVNAATVPGAISGYDALLGELGSKGV